MSIEIKDFKKVNYKQFANVLKAAFEDKNRPVDKIMTKTKRKGIGTISNIFNPSTQKVPDTVLEKAATALGLNCVIAIHGGKKIYFLSNIINDETIISAN